MARKPKAQPDLRRMMARLDRALTKFHRQERANLEQRLRALLGDKWPPGLSMEKALPLAEKLAAAKRSKR